MSVRQANRNKTRFSGVLWTVAHYTHSTTDFEYRHQTLIHQLIVGAAFLTYLIDREDVVWRLAKNTANPHVLERSIFIVAMVFVAVGAGLCTNAYGKAHGTGSGDPQRLLHRSRYLGDISYAIGLGSLAPVAGFLILVVGESCRVLRLAQRIDGHLQNWQEHGLSAPPALLPGDAEQRSPGWKKAFRQEAAKWGIFVTMTVFVVTLQDRQVEVLALASFLVGILLNAPSSIHLKGVRS